MAEDRYEHVATEPQLTELEQAQAELTRLRRLRDKLAECNEIARSMGYDHTIEALYALRAMKRGPRPGCPSCGSLDHARCGTQPG